MSSGAPRTLLRWALAALLLQLAAPQGRAPRYEMPEMQICEAWAGPVPVAMDHSGMDMGRRRAQAMDHSCMMATPQVRKYFIAAEVDEWDYAPLGRDMVKDAEFAPPPAPLADDGHAHDHSIGRRAQEAMDHSMHAGHAQHSAGMWMSHSPSSPMRIGRHYLKMVFREYTDHTFLTPKQRAAEDEHLGILGPSIRAEVCDTIQIVFKNKAPSGYPFSIHPHGVRYAKGHEGAHYADGTDMTGDHIMPGHCAYYSWDVPESAGPGPGDSSTKAWLYHGHVSETGDTNAGLVGAIIIGRAGATRTADRKPKDVDREFVTLFNILDENDSPLLAENAWMFLGLGAMDNATLNVLQMDSDFVESNQMHAINGYTYGNLPGLTMTEGEVVRWHVMGLGNQEDIHTPHWHGQTFVLGGGAGAGQRVDVVNILPATQLTVDATMENPGTWLFHCHVNHHIHGGMTALYTVNPCPTAPASSCSSATPVETPSDTRGELDRLSRRDDAITAAMYGYGVVALLSLVAWCLNQMIRDGAGCGGGKKSTEQRP